MLELIFVYITELTLSQAAIIKTPPLIQQKKNINITYKTNSAQPNRNPRHCVCGIKMNPFWQIIISFLKNIMLTHYIYRSL